LRASMRSPAARPAARVRIELEGDGDALVPVNAGVPQIDDARDPVAQAGKDPENQKKAQKIR